MKSKGGTGVIDSSETKSYSDNIEAKRQAASEALKAEQVKRQEQLKRFGASKQPMPTLLRTGPLFEANVSTNRTKFHIKLHFHPTGKQDRM